MTVVAYRIAKTRFSTTHDEMFSGVGAAINAGRWNSKGSHMVYASESRALATLEVAVHLNNGEVLTSYSVCAITIPDDYYEEVGPADLPADWDERVVNPLSAQSWGDLWLEFGEHPAVAVPSVLIPNEWNFLLNPEHEHFAELKLGDITPYPFDPRIKGNPMA